MKKIFVLLLSFIMIVALTACGSTSPNTTSTPNHQTVGLSETVAFTNLKITATKIEESVGDDFFTPNEGNVFVGITFTLENVSNKELAVSSLMQFEGYVDDVKCEYSLSANCAFENGTLDGSLAPGKKMIGCYAIEVPVDWSTIEINFIDELFSNNSASFIFTK